MSEKCPYCGAIEIYNGHDYVHWDCGHFKYKDDSREGRDERCYEAEIAALKDQLAALKAKLEVWRDLADIVRPMDELKAVQKLEEMGEL